MLEAIKNNFERLIVLYETERQNCATLREELAESRAENEKKQKQITDLKREVDNLKLAGAFVMPVGGDIEAKEKINKLIAEIDRCISLLER